MVLWAPCLPMDVQPFETSSALREVKNYIIGSTPHKERILHHVIDKLHKTLKTPRTTDLLLDTLVTLGSLCCRFQAGADLIFETTIPTLVAECLTHNDARLNMAAVRSLHFMFECDHPAELEDLLFKGAVPFCLHSTHTRIPPPATTHSNNSNNNTQQHHTHSNNNDNR